MYFSGAYLVTWEIKQKTVSGQEQPFVLEIIYNVYNQHNMMRESKYKIPHPIYFKEKCYNKI